MGFSRNETLRVAIDDRLRSVSLRIEQRPVREIAVPFDERRDGSVLANDGVEEFPRGVGDRTVVAVDEQKLALVICLFGMAGEMNLTDVLKRKNGEIDKRCKTMIGGRNEHVVDVEQQAAPGAPNQLRDEQRFAHRRFRKNEIG